MLQFLKKLLIFLINNYDKQITLCGSSNEALIKSGNKQIFVVTFCTIIQA